MRGRGIATTTLTASLVAAAALAPAAWAGATTRANAQRPAAATPMSTAFSTASSSTGVFAYVSDSDYYGSDGKQTLVTVRPDGAHKRTLIRPASVDFGLLQFSPSARRIAYFRATTSAARVYVMGVGNRKVVSLFTLRGSSAYVDGLAWTPSGKALVVGSNERPGSSKVHAKTALWRIPAGGGKPRQITGFEDAGDPTVLPDGDLVYVISKTFSSNALKKSALWMSGPNGSHAHRVLSSSHFVDTPAGSPDGRTVAYTVVVSETTTHLGSVTLATRRQRNLTRPVKGRTDISPSWSPDGTKIVFLSSRGGRHATTTSHQLLDAYVMTATGKNPTKVISRRGDKWSVVLVSWGR